MLSTLLMSLALAVSAPGATIDVPLTGEPMAPSALTAIQELPGVESVAVDGRHLSVHVHPDADVSLREIERLVERHSPSTKVDTDRLVLGPHTIFQLDGGVCFFCAEGPIGMTLARRSFVKSWSVVDYRERGRLRFSDRAGR